MSNTPDHPPHEPASNDDRDSIERLFGQYVDRLNAGEAVDAAAIERRHPEVASELIAGLRSFETFGSEDSVSWSGGGSKTFGGYRIFGELGRGGMGIVYDARDVELDRRVALKVLSAGSLIDRQSVERFRREARIAGQLRHPNIATVFATGVERDTPFLAMEYVEGESLDKVLDRRRPSSVRRSGRSWRSLLSGPTATRHAPVESAAMTATAQHSEATPGQDDEDASNEAIPATPDDLDLEYCIRMARVFADVADGVAHAHDKGIVHRDIKPSNLILEPNGSLRILDFGLAHLEGQEHLTRSGEVVGTPRYMSPEQVRARQIQVDHRTDIYSLGATLYEVLTLVPAFSQSSAQATMTAIVNREPRPPRRWNVRVPRDLETIVLKCLRKDPRDRYDAATNLAEDLRCFARGDPIAARPLGVTERTVRWVRANTKRIALAGIVATLIVILYASQREQSRRASAARYETDVLALVDSLRVQGAFASQADAFAWESTGFDVWRVARNIESYGEESESGDAVSQIVSGLSDALRAAPDRPDARYHLGRAYWMQGDADAALETLGPLVDAEFVPAVVLAASIADGSIVEQNRATTLPIDQLPPGSWGDLWLRAERAMEERRHEDAVASYERLIELEKRGIRGYLGSTVDTYVRCGVAHLKSGDPVRARTYFSAASVVRPGALSPELFLGAAYLTEGDTPEAARVFDRVYARAKSPHVATWAAMLYSARFQMYDEALEWLDRAPKGHATELIRAYCLALLGRIDEALASARRLPELGARSPLSFTTAATVLLNAGELETAEELARTAIRMAPKSGLAHATLANVLRSRQDYIGSYRAILKAVEVEPDSPMPRYFLAQAFRAMGQRDRAIEELTRSIGQFEADGVTESFSFRMDVARAELGSLLAAKGELPEAIRQFELAAEIGQELGSVNPRWVEILSTLAVRHGDLVLAMRSLEDVLENPRLESARVPILERSLGSYGLASDVDLPTPRALESALRYPARRAAISVDASWKYWPGTRSPSPESTAWTTLEFDDGEWRTGVPGFGYGDSDDRTQLPDMRGSYSTVFLRKRFEAPENDAGPLVLSIAADDGFVAYLNGVEIYRVAVEASVPDHETTAVGNAIEPLLPHEFVIDRSRLLPGENILAVVGCNSGPTSSDFSLFPRLEMDFADPSAVDARWRQRLAERSGSERDPSRAAYLEGRLDERAGQLSEADAHFAVAIAMAPDSAPAYVARARVLATLDRSLEAETLLYGIVSNRCPPPREALHAWLELAATRGRSYRLERLVEWSCNASERPPRFTGWDQKSASTVAERIAPSSRSDALDDARWSLERSLEGPIRIDCGGRGGTDSAGTQWESDRCYAAGFAAGVRAHPSTVPPTGESTQFSVYSAARYVRDRHFGYSFPLPPATYRLRLHTVERSFETPGHRQFDVLVDGETILEGIDAFAAAGFDPHVVELEVTVTDGVLDLTVRPHATPVPICAIEILR